MAKKAKKVPEIPLKPNLKQGTFFGAALRAHFFETLVFFFSFFLYLNSIPNGYNMDDELVTINHRLTSKGVSAVPQIFTSPYYKDDMGYAYEYRPIVHVSFAIEHQFFGDNPYVSHFFNVFLYSLACVILFKVLSSLFSQYSFVFSAAITILFAAHTAHTEAVCSIKNRDELLGLAFSLLAFFYSLKFVRERKWWLLITVLTFTVLALLSKLTFAMFAIIISLAIIIFYPVSYIQLISLGAVLLVPALYLQNALDGYTKLLVLLTGLLGISLLYIIRNVPIQEKTEQLFVLAKNFFTAKKYSFSELHQLNDKENFFKQILPDFSKFTLRQFLLVMIPLSAFFIGGYLQLFALKAAAIAALILLLFRKDEYLHWFTCCAFYAILIARFNYLNYFPRTFYIEFFCLPLVYTIVYENRKLFLPTTITLCVLLVFQVDFFAHGKVGNVFTAAIYLFCIFLARYRYGWIAALFFSVINFVALYIDHLAHPHVSYYYLGMTQVPFLLVLFTIFLIYFKRNAHLLMQLFLVASLLVTLPSLYAPPPAPQLGQAVIGVANNLNPVIISNKQDRPVLYLEEVIDYNKTPLSVKLGTSLEVLYHYAVKVILPYPLSFYYGYSFIKPMKATDTIPVLSMIFHLMLLAVAVYFIKRDIRITFGLLVYLISIALFSNYFMGVPGMLADRFLLVPSLGWIIVLVSAIQIVFKVDFKNKNLAYADIATPAKYSFIAVLVFYSALTFSRNLDWKDYLVLFRHDIKYVDQSAQAHNLLALRLMKVSMGLSPGQVQEEMQREALAHFKKSIEIYPYFFNTNYDVARVSALLNEPDSAILYFKKASSIDSSNIDPYVNIGKLLMDQKKFNEAAPCFEYIINKRPRLFSAYQNLSFAYYSLQDFSKSIAVNKAAAIQFPSQPGPYINIGRTFYTMNQIDSARYYVEKALLIEPNNSVAHSLLAQWQKNK